MHFLAGEEALNLDGITSVAKGNGRENRGRFPSGTPRGGMSQLYIYGKCVPVLCRFVAMDYIKCEPM